MGLSGEQRKERDSVLQLALPAGLGEGKPAKIDRREKVIAMIMDHPEMTASQIGKELGEKPDKVLYWVRRLSRQGVI